MKRRIFSHAAAAGLVLIAASCAEVPRPEPDAPAAVVPVAAPPAPASGDDARALIGRKASEIAGLLGPPQLKRRDPPAELWQYRAGPCVLDLFLYADKEGGAATVAHVEMRAAPPVGGPTTEFPRALSDASDSSFAPLAGRPGRAGEAEATRAECLRAVRNASGGG
jgi:hypothetical protein